MNPHPIDHPLAIAKLETEAVAYTAAQSGHHAPMGVRNTGMAAARADAAWKADGCPLYQDPDTTGDDDAR